MRRRTFLKTLAAVPAVTLWGADDELRIAVNQTTLESSPLLVREIPGVRVVLVENGRAASAQLVGGMVDAATGSETQALVNSVQQTDLRIILTLAESHYRMVARKPAGIRRVADLRGKRVGITPRTSSEYFLVDMLRAAGMNLGDVTAGDAGRSRYAGGAGQEGCRRDRDVGAAYAECHRGAGRGGGWC
ncbi:MAG: ABC transporter substrate-binding protein [Acidobacteriota bacterium]